MELCQQTDTSTKYWKQWLQNHKDKTTPPNELLGLLPEEYDDLINELRSFDFYVLKRKEEKYIKQLWAGCYIKFAYESDLHNPHFEYGWVDLVSNEHGFCKVQCDDSYNGNRAITIRIIDVIQILPFKERPLIYYKTMLCGDCNDCDRMSIELPPETCKLYQFYNAIISKQKSDNNFIKLYKHVEIEMNNINKQCNCNKCSKNC